MNFNSAVWIDGAMRLKTPTHNSDIGNKSPKTPFTQAHHAHMADLKRMIFLWSFCIF